MPKRKKPIIPPEEIYRKYEEFEKRVTSGDVLYDFLKGLQQADNSLYQQQLAEEATPKPSYLDTLIASFKNANALWLEYEKSKSDYIHTPNPNDPEAIYLRPDYSKFDRKQMAAATAKFMKTDFYKSLTDEQKEILRGKFVPDIETAINILDRHRIITENIKDINDEYVSAKILGTITGAMTSDPTTLLALVPGLGAGVMAKRIDTVLNSIKATKDLVKARSSYLAGVVAENAAIGALSGAGYQYIHNKSFMEDESLITPALIGAVLGGGLGGFLAKRNFNSNVAKFLQGKEGNPEYSFLFTEAGAIPKQKLGGIPFINKFFANDQMHLLTSNSQLVRDVVSKIHKTGQTLFDSNGKRILNKATVADADAEIEGLKDIYHNTLQTHYAEALRNGFEGSLDDFNQAVGKELIRLMSKQEEYIDNAVAIEKAKYEQEHLSFKMQEAKIKYLENKIEDLQKRIATEPSLKDELDNIINQYNKEVEIYSNRKTELAKEFDELAIKNKAYNEYKYKINTGIPALDKAIQDTINYYKIQLQKFQEVGVERLENISHNKLYYPIQYNFNIIEEMSDKDLANLLYGALKGENVTLNDAIGLANHLKTLAFDKNFRNYSYLTPKDLPFKAFLKERKLKIDYSKIMDILVTDAMTISEKYAYQMGKQYGFAKIFGTNNYDKIRDEIINPLRYELQRLGEGHLVPKLESLFEDAMGVWRLDKNDTFANRFARAAGAYDYLVFGGSFAFNNIAEFGTLMWATQFRNIFNSQWGSAIGAIKDTLYKQVKAGNYELANELMITGAMNDLLTARQMDRAMSMGTFNMSRIEDGLSRLSNFMSKISGLQATIAVGKVVAGSNLLNNILKSKGNIHFFSQKEWDDFYRWGLDEEAVLNIYKELKRVARVKENGAITTLNLSLMNKKAIEDITYGVGSMIRETVMSNNSKFLPSWMTKGDSPATKIFTRFLSAPVILHNSMVARGLSHDQIGLIISTLLGFAGFTLFKHLQEEAQVAIGYKKEENKRWDIFSDDPKKVAKAIFNGLSYTAPFGLPSVITGWVQGITGFKPEMQDYLGNVYETLGGPTVGRLQDTRDIIQHILEGRYSNVASKQVASMFIPFQSLPILHEGIGIAAEALSKQLEPFDEIQIKE